MGASTELGQINRMLSDIQALSTPLMRQIDRFGQRLAVVILAAAAATFVLGTWWRGQPASDMFMMVVALAASAIPERLPAIMTVTPALGVQRMARRNAIVRRLPAVEALGSVTVICSDKTGTLTRNEMTVQRVVCAGHAFDVGGVGYAPVGDCSIDGRIIEPARYPALSLALRAGVLCNDARMRQDAEAQWRRLDSLPFESQHPYMATHHQDAEGQSWLFLKGAPERVLDMCDRELAHAGERPLDADHWRRMATDTAAQGLRWAWPWASRAPRRPRRLLAWCWPMATSQPSPRPCVKGGLSTTTSRSACSSCCPPMVARP
ncbi:MAG: HAD-IC family P-type ATPase [Aquabacterium sp.]|jgi:magnesium-transporting ATPase (P-type)